MSERFEVRTSAWLELDDSTRRNCAELWTMVWPSDGVTADDRVERVDERDASCEAHQVHLAMRDGVVLAVSRTFLHTVRLGDVTQPIVALASVCSSPNHRGEGLGDAVVVEAFRRVLETGFPSLFQTGVPTFYERFGSRIITNHIMTSAPNAMPFTDDCAMIHPGDTPWDDRKTIDLLSSGW